MGFYPELNGQQTQEAHPFFNVAATGQARRLSSVAMRYYYTPESDIPETATCYWVTGDLCALARMTFRDVAEPTPDATRYLEVTFPDAKSTLPGGGFEVRVGFKTGSATMMQSNDYSFDAAPAAPTSARPFPYKPWQRVTLYFDGKLTWGTEPCASTTKVTFARGMAGAHSGAP